MVNEGGEGEGVHYIVHAIKCVHAALALTVIAARRCDCGSSEEMHSTLITSPGMGAAMVSSKSKAVLMKNEGKKEF